MENFKYPENNSIENIVNEPMAVYGTRIDIELENQNTTEQEILLKKLLAKAIETCESDQGISNEEMKKRTKQRFPFLK
ncbi:MAG: hypothetical protein RLZZ312_662 [Bacteroidota bacterium]|jgi:hypothetical protein